MRWYQEEEDEDDLMFSPALLARRASESWIETPPVEVKFLHIPCRLFYIPKKKHLTLIYVEWQSITRKLYYIQQNVPVNVTLQRKKSLPDVQQLPYSTGMMSREEVSALGSARREEVRRRIDESERLRANPLLYLVSPQVKVRL